MDEGLDGLIARLAAQPVSGRLDGLELEVGRSIIQRRCSAATAAALTPVRIASIAMAMALGVTVGGAAATAAFATPHGYGAFSGAAHLAPSTLLGAR